MIVIRQQVPRDSNLFLYGDDHEGSINRWQIGWEAMVNAIESEYDGIPEENNRAIDHGDPVEAICLDDPRYDPAITEGNLFQQITNAVRHRHPFAHKILGMTESNHPRKLWRFGPVTEEICKRLEIPFLTWTVIFEYVDDKDRLLFRHLATHGPERRTIRSVLEDPAARHAAELRQLRRLMQDMNDSCLLMSCGHTHRLLYSAPVHTLYMGVNGGSLRSGYRKSEPTADFIQTEHRHYVNTGSFSRLFVEGVSGYAERAGYKPTDLGFAVAKVRDGKLTGVDTIPLGAGSAA